MMKTNASQSRMKAKARAAMEPGLVSTRPQVAVKRENNMRAANAEGQKRPIGLKSGGAVHSEKGEKKADVKQDKAMIARHNRLMHPGQKSKLASGGMAKMAAGGAAKVRKGVATPSGAPKQQPRNKNPAYR